MLNLKNKRIVTQPYSATNKGRTRYDHVIDLSTGIEYKFCSHCQRFLPISQFNKNRNTWDKLTSQCKNCHKHRFNKKKPSDTVYQKEITRISFEEAIEKQFTGDMQIKRISGL